MAERKKRNDPKYVFMQRNSSNNKIDTSSQFYFHGAITREVAERRLSECPPVDGTFLLRASVTKVGNNVLSVVYKNKIVHYQVNKKADNLVSIDGGPSFAGPVELVEYYKGHQDRLLTVLTAPCNRQDTDKVELYKGITHEDLEEATKAVLLNNNLDVHNKDVMQAFKTQFEAVIGNILHKEQPWFHGIIPRTEAESRLQAHGLKDGKFLFRERGTPQGTFALVLCYQNKTYHYLFERNANGQLSIKQGRLFENLMGVVSYYSQNNEGLWSTLKEACDVRQFQYRPKTEVHIRNILLNTYIQESLNKELLRKPSEQLKRYSIKRESQAPTTPHRSPANESPSSAPVRSPSGKANGDGTPPRRVLPPVPGNDAWKTEKIYDTTKLAQTAGYVRLTQEKSPLQLDSRRLTLEEELGHGNFGSVMKGMYVAADSGRKIPVAVKTLKTDDIPNQKEEVLAEASIMAKLDHPHIVRLIGVTQSPSLMIVMEIAPLGPLNKYLKKNRRMQILNILILMLQVDEGMDYLESQRFVHRDLAARNVLVVSEDYVKISDFGMSRATGAGNEYYRAERAGRWPLKWYAPECIYFRKFTSKSDVWSFGVTLWEALTFGEKPFAGLKGPQIVEGIESGKRLQQPPSCPDEVYEIMMNCWQYKEEHRPTFNEIGSRLHKFLQQPFDEHKYVNDEVIDDFAI